MHARLNSGMQYPAEVGVNTYIRIKMSFLSKEVGVACLLTCHHIPIPLLSHQLFLKTVAGSILVLPVHIAVIHCMGGSRGGCRGCAPPFRPKVPFFCRRVQFSNQNFPQKRHSFIAQKQNFPQKPRKGTHSLHKTQNFPQKKPCIFCN
jgi:hypothetical protein